MLFTALAMAASEPPVVLTRIATSLAAPTCVTNAGDGSGRLFVAEQGGRVRVIAGGNLRPAPFLDLSRRVSCCGDAGLLSITFPPGSGPKRHLYVHYSGSTGDVVLSRIPIDPGGERAEADGEEVILRLRPHAAIHHGGQAVFGPDGYLYFGLGDGGPGNDPFDEGQSRTSLLGKVLRLDVESAEEPYGVPASNPFVGNPNFRAEIWALGLRNPWRLSFDRLTGDLWIADVGQNTWEEVNVQGGASPGGENYGWRRMEGPACFAAPACEDRDLVPPVYSYDHLVGCAVTGGFVYRGTRIAGLEGAYVFSDYCAGKIWALRRNAAGVETTVLAEAPTGLVSFGEDEAGELVLADQLDGAIHRIDPSPCLLSTRTDVPDAIPIGAPATFAATVAVSGCAAAPALQWEFGDGSPPSGEPTASHSYQRPGRFTWKLTASAGDATATTSRTITVGAAPRRSLPRH